MPRVSVLLPARNAAATLASCLRSVARQTERSWECIVVDDGSSDATGEIARAAAGRDPRFRVVSTPPQGLIAALNVGLRHCRAPLIARFDADDVMHRDRLAVQTAVLERDATLAGVGCHVRLFPRRRLSPYLRDYERWLNGLRSAEDVARDAFVECPLAHPGLMMRRDAMADGYADRGWPEDYDLVLRTLADGRRLGVVPRRLVAWRYRPDSLSRTDARYALERFTACKAHFLAAQFLRSPDYVLWGYGSTGRALRRALAALGKTATHIVEIKRTRLGQRIHGAPVVGVEALPSFRSRSLIVSVAREGPRREIREALDALGFAELRDYVCAA